MYAYTHIKQGYMYTNEFKSYGHIYGDKCDKILTIRESR